MANPRESNWQSTNPRAKKDGPFALVCNSDGSIEGYRCKKTGRMMKPPSGKSGRWQPIGKGVNE